MQSHAPNSQSFLSGVVVGDPADTLTSAQREVLQRAVGKIVAAGLEVGVTADQMIELLRSGLTVDELLEFLTAQCAGTVRTYC
jgi:hypothetical protein